jgi:hypothetical protein
MLYAVTPEEQQLVTVLSSQQEVWEQTVAVRARCYYTIVLVEQVMMIVCTFVHVTQMKALWTLRSLCCVRVRFVGLTCVSVPGHPLAGEEEHHREMRSHLLAPRHLVRPTQLGLLDAPHQRLAKQRPALLRPHFLGLVRGPPRKVERLMQLWAAVI